MALIVKDRVQETSTTTGTGTVTLLGAVTGFQSFSVIGNANTTYYAIIMDSDFEIGIGTYTASGTTLSRTTVLESSNAGSLVNFTAGTKSVFCTYPAEKAIYADASDVVNPPAAIIGAPNTGSVIPFYFANQAAFPSASTYHGAIAHSHSDGAMYFAHGGVWVRILDTGGPLGTPSSGTATNLTGLPLSTGVTGTLPIANGGTGTTSTTFTNLTTNVTGTLPVANGGTGRATNTAFAVICGGTTAGGVEQSIASVGTAAQVLTSNGSGALPTFQTPAAGGTTIPSGTVMLFAQTSAPTGFTKLTDQDNASLRVVSGSASTGGSVGFTTAFASQTPTGSVAISSVSGSAGATTLTTPQIPSHSHVITGKPTDAGSGPITNCVIRGTNPPLSSATDNAGGGDSHTHPFSFSSGSGTFTGNAINLAVKYVDVIRATKD